MTTSRVLVFWLGHLLMRPPADEATCYVQYIYEFMKILIGILWIPEILSNVKS